MIIHSFLIENFKCFNSPIELKFDEGINILVGENNSGKSTLLNLLRLINISSNPHVTPFNNMKGKHAKVLFEYSINSDEFWKYFNKNDNNTFQLKSYRYGEVDGNRSVEIRNAILGKRPIYFWGELNGADYFLSKFDEFNSMGYEKKQLSINLHSVNQNPPINNVNCTLRKKLHSLLIKKIFVIPSERINFSEINVENSTLSLQPNGSNLLSVLNTLANGDIGGFSKIITEVKKIFPEITHISIPITNNNFRMKVWLSNPGETENQVSYYINECGSGLHQLIFLFTALNVSKEQRIFLIDEPQKYLHPNSIKKLFKILKEDYSDHQYIVATHSPFVIKACEPCPIILLSRDDTLQTRAEIIDADDSKGIRKCMSELGIQFSDIFGIDKVVWVEGISDKVVFSRLAKEFSIFSEDVQFKSFSNTGDLEQRNDRFREIIVNLYCDWSNVAFNPKMILLFDGDKKEVITQKIQRIDPDKKNKVAPLFLKRYMLENYFLNEDAIKACILEYPDKLSISEEELSKRISKYFVNHEEFIQEEQKKYRDKNGIDEEDWNYYIHAKNFLNKIFDELIQRKYSEVNDGEFICTWLVENECEIITELVEELEVISSQ